MNNYALSIIAGVSIGIFLELQFLTLMIVTYLKQILGMLNKWDKESNE